MEKEDDKLFKRDICCFDFRSNFLVLILFCSILEKKDDKSFERDIIVLISFLILFCFNFFSGKYWKRNVLSGVPYKADSVNIFPQLQELSGQKYDSYHDD